MSSDSSLATARFAYEPGDVIASKYELEALLASGGMGAVFRARNTVIDMPVAIKLIRADLDREELAGRLLQEARAAAKLSHPAIVRVFDVGQTALGDPFIVMELLEGEPLSALMAREGRMSGARAVQLLLPIADALSTAHAKGFVHRDVKPDNVFLSRSSEGPLQPKLVDFGIVKQDGPTTESLTQIGSVVGSPEYMSPEQARGLDSVDPRSDIWSFCVVVYEAITGRTPFESENYNALLQKILGVEPPTLRELQAADARLSAIIAKGLSKDPAQRFASFGQLGRALAGWLHENGVTEDVCGASLEARWLSRTSPGGSSPFSSGPPDSWPEPLSGVRRLGFAPTVAQSRHSGTPHALAQTQAAPRTAKGRARVLALAAVLAVGGGFAVHAGLRSSAPRPRAAAPTEGVERPSPPPVAAEPLPSAAPSAVSLAPEPVASAAPSVSVRRAPPRVQRKPRVAKPPARPATTSTARPGATDLLTPY